MSNYKSELQSNNADLQAILDAVNNLPDASNGVELPDLTNAASAGDIISGKEAIDGEGNKITGNFSIDSELNTQDSLISQIQDVVNNLPEAGSSGATIEAWTGTVYISSVLGEGGTRYIHYIDENLNHQSLYHYGGGVSYEITIAARTFIMSVEDLGNSPVSYTIPTLNNFTVELR